MHIESAENAFRLAKEIRCLMGELLEELNALGKVESIPTQQRHLIMKQVCSYFSDRNQIVEDYAKNFLDNNVEPAAKMKVPGLTLGEEGESLCVAGLEYNYAPTHKVEILNKDDNNAWTKLVIALANAGYAHVIQKRLTASHFLKDEKLLEVCMGLVGTSTEGSWSITKPREPKTLRHTGKKS